jgi:hypothetical protein
MRYEFSRTLPAPRREGYAYMTDLTTWGGWSPIEIPDADSVGFDEAGDSASFVYRPVGIPVRGTMHLVDLRPGESWTVRFEQKGFADVEMSWSFSNAGAHAFTVDVTVETQDIDWWDTLYEWIALVPVWIRRDLRRALETLHEHYLHPEIGVEDEVAAS